MRNLLLTSIAVLSLGGAAYAQDAAKTGTAAPPPPASAAAAATSVSDEEVQKVAALGAEVKALNLANQPKIAAAADAEAKTAAQKTLDDGVQAALDKSGLTVARYNEIAKAAQTDKALAAKITAAGSAATGASAPAAAAEPERK